MYKEFCTAKVNEEENFKEIILRGEKTGRHFSPPADAHGAGMFKDGERYVMTIEPVPVPRKASKKKAAAKTTKGAESSAETKAEDSENSDTES